MNDIEEMLRRMVEQGQAQPWDDDDDLIIDAELVDDPPTAEYVEVEMVEASIAKRLPSAEPGTGPPRQIDQADERMEDHLRDVFEHRLGDLGTQTASAAESRLDPDEHPAVPPIQSSADIVAALHHPQSLRNLIVLSEILKRPDRW